jgi:low affinity Fe/Cu permease
MAKLKDELGRMISPKRRDLFTRIATWTIRVTGGRWGFFTAFALVVVWAVSGPIFHYSADWQLVINTGTTIVTFLMVFLIQNAQNRESKAVHLKLDELILAVNRARNELIDIENLTEEQLNALSERYTRVAAEYQHKRGDCSPSGRPGPRAAPVERAPRVGPKAERDPSRAAEVP